MEPITIQHMWDLIHFVLIHSHKQTGNMEEEKIYNLSKNNLNKVVRFIMLKYIMAQMTNDIDAIDPKNLYPAVCDFIDKSIKQAA